MENDLLHPGMKSSILCFYFDGFPSIYVCITSRYNVYSYSIFLQSWYNKHFPEGLGYLWDWQQSADILRPSLAEPAFLKRTRYKVRISEKYRPHSTIPDTRLLQSSNNNKFITIWIQMLKVCRLYWSLFIHIYVIFRNLP